LPDGGRSPAAFDLAQCAAPEIARYFKINPRTPRPYNRGLFAFPFRGVGSAPFEERAMQAESGYRQERQRGALGSVVLALAGLIGIVILAAFLYAYW
jgi:hypothetical protein